MIDFLNFWAFALLPLPALIWFFGPALPARSAVAVPESVLATLRHLSGARGDDRVGQPADLLLRIIGWTALSSPSPDRIRNARRYCRLQAGT